MKTRTTFILSFTAILTLAAGSAFGKYSYSGGSGTAGDPYQIATDVDLLLLDINTADYGKCFILTADINLASYSFTKAVIAYDTNNSNYTFDGIAFTGVFDGNGHKISNLIINNGAYMYLGLFGKIGSGGSVKNIGLENVSVTGSPNNGIGPSILGGLVGENDGNISNCYSTGTVSGSYSSTLGVLVGYNSGTVSNCYSTGAVTDFNTCNGFGGLVGSNEGTISNCYSTGTITTGIFSSYLGGLVGYNSGSISNCYSTGAIVPSGNNSTYLGGLVGYNNGSPVKSSFWDVNTSGRLTSSGGGKGETTDQMKALSTFTSAGWDFTNETANGTNDYWRMCVDGVNYPQLNWQYAQYGDFACPDGVGMEDLTYFVGRWLESDCDPFSNNSCGGTDMNASGTVDFEDFAIFADNWLSSE